MNARLQSEVHVWDLTFRATDVQYLPPEEKARWSRIKNEETRTSFVTSQGGLRRVLSEYLGCAPVEVSLLRGIHGKPYLAGGPEFNLSHTAGRTFLLVAKCAVGLDVESASRLVRADELARKFFFPEEQVFFRGLDAAAKNTLFLRYWVCKESMVKLSGEGIYYGLRHARVIHGPDGLRGEYRGRPVQLSEFSPAPGFLAAATSWEALDVKCFLQG